MNEFFLHYIWRFQLFNSKPLTTTEGKSIKVDFPGTSNKNGGPDFWDARLNIGNTKWIGQVEIHVKASDWHKHKHTADAHYKNVILHVVYDNDEPIFLHQPGDLEVLELPQFLEKGVSDKYESWLSNKAFISCERDFPFRDPLIWQSWKDRVLIERMENKVNAILLMKKTITGNWSELAYRLFARGFGLNVNADAFEYLAITLPLNRLVRHSSDPFQLEALFFGQAGWLNSEFEDEYPNALRREYLFLQHKYDLHPMTAASWNFGRLRPTNFPTIRVAQLADFISRSEQLMSKVLNFSPEKIIDELIESRAHPYWSQHFTFDGRERFRVPREVEISARMKQSLIINVVVPLLVAYSKEHDQKKYIDKAEKLLELCLPEENTIVSGWKKIGERVQNACDTQALLHLHKHYCESSKCLECALGLQFLTKERI